MPASSLKQSDPLTSSNKETIYAHQILLSVQVSQGQARGERTDELLSERELFFLLLEMRSNEGSRKIRAGRIFEAQSILGNDSDVSS